MVGAERPAPRTTSGAPLGPARPASRRVALRGYVALVSLAGIGLGAALSRRDGADLPVRDDPVTFAVFTALLMLGEMWPLHVRRRHEEGQITASSTFALGLLLAFGTAPAVLAFSAGSAVVDFVWRRPAVKIVFNAAQYALMLGTAGLAYERLAPTPLLAPGTDLTLATFGAVGTAALVFFLVNNVLTGVVVSLDRGYAVLSHLAQGFWFHAFTTLISLALAPVVVVVAQRSLWLIPVLVLPVVAVFRSARISMEKEHQAFHDSLSGLPNRALFQDRVEQALLHAQRSGTSVAVMLVDLDRFKEVNDTLGHQAGDELLKQVGPRLQDAVREIDTISRFGGDEFAVLLTDMSGSADALAVAGRIVDALEQPFVVDEFKLDIEASIGIALFPEHGADVDTLLQRADVAMYLAKASHGGYELYSTERDHNSRRRLGLLGELRQAMTEKQLVVEYQPKADLRSGRVTGVEALVRWHHPEHGLVPPGEFVPLAEHTGLIRTLTRYVLNEALAQCRTWQDQGLSIPVAVNLSVRNLHDLQLPGEIAELLGRWEVSASQLELEITESVIMADPVRARKVLVTLAAMGIRLAIDDFGTGYSSLAYLKRLPVKEIKIDKSFVLNMEADENDRVIVRSIIDLGRNLGLEVTAEGIESAEVWDLLAGLRCHSGQGWHLSRPMPAEKLAPWLHDRENQLATEPVRSNVHRLPTRDAR